MKSLFTIGLFLLLPLNHLFAQNHTVDSLISALDNATLQNDKKVELLIAVGNKLMYSKPQQAIHYLEQVYPIAPKTTKQDHYLVLANLWEGIAYQYLSEFAKSRAYTQKAFNLAEKHQWKEYMGAAYGTFGLDALNQGNFIGSLKYFQEASNYYRQANDPKELFMYNNMAAIYSKIKNFEKAEEYFNKVFQGAIKNNDSERIATSILNIGSVLLDQKLPTQSLGYLNFATHYFEQKNDINNLPKAYGNKGIAFKELKQWDSAIYFTQKAMVLNEKIGNKRSIAIQKSNLGNYYTELNQLSKAKTLLDDAQTQANNLKMKDLQRDVAQNLSLYFEQARNADSALFYLKKYMVLNEGLNGEETQQKMVRLELQFDYNKKADSLKFRNQLTALQLQQQVLLSQQQQQKLLWVEKENQLQKLLDIKRISELQQERINNDEKERQLNQANNDKKFQQIQIASLDKDNSLNKLRLRQQWLFTLGSILLLGGMGSIFLYRYRNKQTKLQTQLALEKAEFENKMNVAALSTLRSQMNPHFIFNCLNSIRLFAAKNDSLSATNYISKFSRLMRLVLENSKNERITLQQEIETLQLYIDLELMRFKDKLKYDIHFTNGMDTEFIEVPPMLIQPYVENAIWHGLMHKETGGQLKIDITENEEMLLIKIEDNGIGRAKAMELKHQSATHRSFAMNITQERLDLMNMKYGTKATVVINDLYKNGVASGTEVCLNIPIL